MEYLAIILAAGKGSRLKSKLAKPLHKVAGRSLISWVSAAANTAGATSQVCVVSPDDQQLCRELPKTIKTVIQDLPKGTGDAVRCCLPHINQLPKDWPILILYADTPLIQADTLRELANRIEAGADICLVGFTTDNPNGYGRIVLSEDKVVKAIIEHKDAASKEREIKEVNSGILAVKTATLQKLLPLIKNNNAAKEYYLTDLIEIANKFSIPVRATLCEEHEVGGANSKQELHDLERSYQKRLAESLLAKDVLVADTSRLDIRGNSQIGKGSFIDINNVFEGQNKIGKNVHIGPNCHIINSTIKDNTVVYSNTVIEDCEVGANCKLGPFSRIRGGSELTDGSELGNFVEANRSKIGKGSKAKHLTYLGDARLGQKVNVGAGTITCNYDGKNKHKTIIEDGTFIGSNSSLVAPLTLGEGSYTGAGSVITKNVPKGKLAVGRGKQLNLNKKK